jgi:hypothetical protein
LNALIGIGGKDNLFKILAESGHRQIEILFEIRLPVE